MKKYLLLSLLIGCESASAGLSDFRSIDGSGNTATEDSHLLMRMMDSDYADGHDAMSAGSAPSARAISNAVSAQEFSERNPLGASDYLWQWGQFVDHDISLTEAAEPAEPADIEVPKSDVFFDPDCTGAEVIEFSRSAYDPESSPREQLNEITYWIDGSNVYGSTPRRATALRTNDGSGRLKTSEGQLLPFNEEGLPNAGGPSPGLFLAGDIRANEQAGLTAVHVLFVREHNRLADAIRGQDPSLAGEDVYQRARRMVVAIIQAITYQEYIPALLGPGALREYEGYDPSVDARISNIFSTAIYRFGHSAVSPVLLRLDSEGNDVGALPLQDAFFTPNIIVENGIDSLLRGLAAQECQRIDTHVVDALRNFLFGPPGAGGFDLAALNIQRGRDHGLPRYNAAREFMGLGPATVFPSVYASADDVDVWVGALSEPPVNGGHVGELSFEIMRDQFERLRDGDRYWYQGGSFTRAEVLELQNTRLSDVIRRNTDIGEELADDVFHVGESL